MKAFNISIFLLFSIFTAHNSLSQDITSDTTLANEYFKTAQNYIGKYDLDSALLYSGKAQELYLKQLGEISLKNANVLHLLGIIYYYGGIYDESLNYYYKSLNIRITLLGENHSDVANSYSNIAIDYWVKGEFQKSLDFNLKSLKIRLFLFGENNIDVAKSYNNTGAIYEDLNEYEIALKYFIKALEIRKNLLGERHIETAQSFDNIGNVYDLKSEYDKGLEYHFKALQIRKEILGNMNLEVAASYHNIGLVYLNKNMFDLALDYNFQALNIRKEILGEKNIIVATNYNNIGIIYGEKNENNLALEYFLKALSIKKYLFGERNIQVASGYGNIGILYCHLKEYDQALENHLKALQLQIELLGETSVEVAASYGNTGEVYMEMGQYDSAMFYNEKSLHIKKEILGIKHTDLSSCYNNMGVICSKHSEFDKALQYHQKALVSGLRNFNDTLNIDSVPKISDYFEWHELLNSLQAKAEIYANYGVYKYFNPNVSLLHFLACDTLITRVRKEITSQSDKIALGEKANDVYKKAVNLCANLIIESNTKIDKRKYKNLSFYFSERNKSSVLLEALSGAEALEFAGIPDSFLQKEHELNISIANYINLINNNGFDSLAYNWKDRLFNANRSYDSLITVFETNYPNYYQLKYNNKPLTVDEIQTILDKNTSIMNYFVLDSSMIIYFITKKKFETYKVPLINDFEIKLIEFRTAMQTGTDKAVFQYKTLAYELYKQLFPKELMECNSFKSIKNLIIIPDSYLASIPFEALLTENYSPVYDDWKTPAYFSEMPYLINKYTISYSYSATLFHNTFKKPKSDQVEFSDLNDWLAFAPVFDNDGTAGTNTVTRKLLSEIEQSDFNDSDQKRTFLRDGSYISPLPGSLDEVNEIFKLYDNYGKKAKIYTHKKADESLLKSGELENYRILHFATHGFVNTEKPELSGILTAQDTSVNINDYEDIYGNITQQNDGIWYQSEIYNTKLNADLVVLSACETGLGKQVKGEGVIGLTRALLYAGAKNIIVSLWQVSDESTKELMIDFYKNLLEKSSSTTFAEHLRQAKLKLIKEGKYAHPFFWSPFILIGK